MLKRRYFAALTSFRQWLIFGFILLNVHIYKPFEQNAEKEKRLL